METKLRHFVLSFVLLFSWLDYVLTDPLVYDFILSLFMLHI